MRRHVGLLLVFLASVLVELTSANVCAVIPARFASTRFRGKLLKPLMGKPLLQLTYEHVAKASLVDSVWIATESSELAEAARKFTSNVIMTSDKPINGMERIGEAEAQLPAECTTLVNVHGDEPFVDPEHVNAVVKKFSEAAAQGGEGELVTTLRRKIKNEEEGVNRGIIKMVLGPNDRIQYLSRALVPHSKKGEFDTTFDYWSHINIHCFPRGFASKYRYLRILFMGTRYISSEVGESERDVNTEEDYHWLVNKYGKSGEL